MALQREDRPWIKGTPLGISLWSIEHCPPHYYENILEPVNFILADHDIHYYHPNRKIDEEEKHAETITLGDLSEILRMSGGHLSHRLAGLMMGFRDTLPYIRAGKSEILLGCKKYNVKPVPGEFIKNHYTDRLLRSGL